MPPTIPPERKPVTPGSQNPWQALNSQRKPPVQQSLGNFPQQTKNLPANNRQRSNSPDNYQLPRKTKKRMSVLKLVLIVLFSALLIWGGYIGINSLRENQVKQSIVQYQDVFAPNIYVNNIPLSGLKPEAALDTIINSMQQRIDSWNLAIGYGGHTFANLNYGTLGISISEEELYQLLNEAWAVSHTGNVYQQRAAIEQLNHTPLKLTTQEGKLDDSKLDNILLQIAPYLTAEPVDAAILAFQPDEQDPFLFQNERQGMIFNIEKNKTEILRLANAGQSGSFELQVEFIQPLVTRAQLEQKVALRTTVTTAISRDSSEKRNHNISLSFSRFNGMILKPGQVFSFNDVVGPRTERAGFQEAMEYAYGDLVIGIGGGVCQASTTLYQAAVTAGLTIGKRYPHSGPVDYTQLGQDATVYMHGGYEIDFTFRNTSSDNIYLAARVKPSQQNSKRLVAEIKIYGQSLGEGVSYRLRSEVVETIPIPDKKVYEVDLSGTKAKYTDQEVLKTKGREGQVVETYLEKLINGILVEQPKLISRDTFKARAPVYYRGVTKRD